MFIFLAALFITKLSKNAVSSVPKFIKANYGEDKLRMIRKLFKLHRKLAKSQLDIQFIKMCILYNLAPKMTRFRLHKDSLSNSRMANTFRNNILRTELRLHHRKMNTLHRQIEDMESSIYGFQSIFTFFSKARIRAFIKKSLDNYIFSVKCTHNRKLSDLGLHNRDDINDSAIYNDTDVIFSEDEISLLSKGLKFSYFPDRINLKKVQAEFENV